MNRLASRPAMTTKLRPNVLILKTGPRRRYCRRKNVLGSRQTDSAVTSGRPRTIGGPPAPSRAPAAVGLTARTSAATACPIRSRRLTMAIRSRAFANSSTDSTFRHTAHASTRVMMTMSAGSGMSSLNNTRMTRSLTCSCGVPLVDG